MNFNKINELKPYDLNCNIFDVYSYDGLSMQELLCQFFTKINECINTSNETINLAEWLVNEGLKQEVALKLTNWLNDGTLENLINVTLFENLNKRIDDVSSQLEDIEKKININVLDFGAKGDGSTDDTEAIQNAIDYAHANNIPNVIIPKGVYIIKDTTEGKGLIPRKNVNIIGIDRPTLLLKSSVCNIISNFIDDFYVDEYSGIENVIIDGIIFDSNGLENGDPCSIIGATGDNYSFGVYIIKAKNITVKNCEFKNSYYGGVNLFGVDGQNIINNKFYNIGNYDGMYKNYSAFGSDATSKYPSKNVVIKYNTVDDCGSVFRANGGLNNNNTQLQDKWVIENNIFKNALRGLTVSNGTYTNIIVKNNEFYNIESRVISFTSEGVTWNRSAYTDNVIFDNNKIVIDKNVGTTGSSLIYTETLSNYIISNNIIDITGDYSENIIITTIDSSNTQLTKNKTLYIHGNNINVERCKYFLVESNDFKTQIYNNNISINDVAVKYFSYRDSNNSMLIINDNILNFNVSKIFNGEPKLRKIVNNVGYVTSEMGAAIVRNNSRIKTNLNCSNNSPAYVFLSTVNNSTINVSYGFDSSTRELVVKAKNINDGSDYYEDFTLNYNIFAWDYFRQN